MNEWRLQEFGSEGKRWYISNGHLKFEIHQIYDGSGRREQYPDGVIVSPEQATEYAQKICDALNQQGVELSTPPTVLNHY